MKPNEALTLLLKEQGYSSGFAAVEALGFKGTLELLVNAVNGSEEGLVKLAGRKEAVTAMFALTGAQADNFTYKLEALKNAMGATDRAYNAQTYGINKVGAQLKSAVIEIQVAAQNFGDSMAPFISSLADMLSNVSKFLSSIDEGGRNTLLVVGGLAAAIGPLLTLTSKIITILAGLRAVKIANTIATNADTAATVTNTAAQTANTTAATANTAAQTANAAATTAAGTAASGAAVGFAALNSAIGLATVGIGLAISAFAYFSAESKRVEQATKERANALEQERKEIENLAGEYKDITSAELIDADAREKLFNIQEKLINQYGVEASAIDLVNGKYNEQIEKLKALSKEKLEIQSVLTLLPYLEAKEELSESQIGYFVGATDRLTKMFTGVTKTDDTAEWATNYNVSLQKSTIEQQIKLYERIQKNAVQFRDDLTKGERSFLEQINAAHAELSSEYDRLISDVERHAKPLFESGYSDNIYKTESALKSFYEALKIKDTSALSGISDELKVLRSEFEDISEQFPEYSKYIDDYLSQINSAFSSITTSFEQLSVDDQLDAYDKLIAQFNKTGAQLGVLTKEEEANKKSLLEIKKAQGDTVVSTKDLSERYNEAASNIKLLTTAQKELNDNHQISADNIVSLLDKYPALIGVLGDEASIKEEINRLLELEIETQRRNFIEKLETSEDYFNQMIKGNDDLWKAINEAYGRDSSNFKSIADVKLQIDNELRRSLGEAWSIFYSSYAGNTLEALNAYIAKYESIKNQFGGLLDVELQEYNRMVAHRDLLAKLAQPIAIAAGTIDFKPTTSSASSKSDSTKAAKQETDNRLKLWQDARKAHEDLMNRQIEVERSYDRLSEEAEIEHYNKIIKYLKQGSQEVLSLTFGTEEERLAIKNEFQRKIEDYEIKQYQLTKKITTNILAAWKEREEHSKRWIDVQKSNDKLSEQAEIEAYDRMIKYLKQAQQEMLSLTYATEADKVAIRKEFQRKIEDLETKQYQIRKSMASEQLSLLQNEIDSYDNLAERLKAYSDLRITLQRELDEALIEINEKYWLSETERMSEIERAYKKYNDTLVDIDKKSYDIRKEILKGYADEWYKTQKTAMDKTYNARKEALNKELQDIRNYYSDIDDEERKRERKETLSDLRAEALKYQGAATAEGRRRYKSILEEIANIEKEVEREKRKEEQTIKEQEVQDRIKALDAEYNAQKDSLSQQYELVKNGTAEIAKITNENLTDASNNLVLGLQAIYDRYNIEFEAFKEQSINSAKSIVADISSILGGINVNFGTLGSGISSGNSTVNTDNSKSLVFNYNDYGDKIITSSDSSESSSFYDELSTNVLYNARKAM